MNKSKSIKYSLKFRKEVKELVMKYRKIAYLDYDIDILYKDGNTDDGVTADIVVLDDYFSADLRVYPLAFEEWKKDSYSLETCISHEIAHLLTEPIYLLIHQTYKSKDEVERAREQNTEKIARIMQRIVVK